MRFLHRLLRSLLRLLRFVFGPTLTHERFLADRHFGGLDGVRAIAALAVVGFHFSGPAPMFAGGWLGVHMFFALSGFLITTLLLREEAVDGRISLAGFWVRRIFRIAPAYYVAFLASYLMLRWQGVWEAAGGPSALKYFLTFNPEFSPSFINFEQAWTIGIEQKFYLVWPLVAFVLIRRRAALRGVGWLLVTGLATWLIWGHSISWVHYVAILLGCGMSIGMHYRASFRVLSLLSSRVVQVAVILALYWVETHSAELTFRWAGPEQLILLFAALCAVSLPSLCGRTEVSRLLALQPFRWLGERSYSIYLFQLIAGTFVSMALPTWGLDLNRALVVAIVSIMIADFAYRFVERPGIMAGRHIAAWLARHPLGRRQRSSEVADELDRQDATPLGEVPAVAAAQERPRQDSNLQPTD